MRQFSTEVCGYDVFNQIHSPFALNSRWTCFALGKTGIISNGTYHMLRRREIIHTADGGRVTRWEGLDIIPSKFPGKKTRSGAIREERSFDLVGTSDAFRDNAVMIPYGGWNPPCPLVESKQRPGADTYLMGTSVKDGGSGIIDGNPAIMRFLGMPDFCSPGARIDEAERPEDINCELIELCGKDHEILKKKAKVTPGWEGFNNLEHKYVVITYGGIDDDKLRLSYSQTDRRKTLYPYVHKERPPINQEAAAAGKAANKRKREEAKTARTRRLKGKAKDVSEASEQSQADVGEALGGQELSELDAGSLEGSVEEVSEVDTEADGVQSEGLVDREVGPYDNDDHRNELRLAYWFRKRGYPCQRPNGGVSRNQAEELGIFLGGRYDKKALGIFNFSWSRIYTTLNDPRLKAFRLKMIKLAGKGPLTQEIEEKVAAAGAAEETSLTETGPVEATDSAYVDSNTTGEANVDTGEPSEVANEVATATPVDESKRKREVPSWFPTMPSKEVRKMSGYIKVYTMSDCND